MEEFISKNFNKDQLIYFTKEVTSKIGASDDWIDEHLDGIKDYTDTLSDLATPIKSVISLVNFIKTRKFKSFLKSYSSEIKKVQGEEINEEYAIKLKGYLSRQTNLNCIYESIDASIQANSIYSSMCIGYIAGRQMGKLDDVNNKILILINAFKNLNDFELYSAIRIIEAVPDYTKSYSIKDLKVISIGTLSQYTVMKLKNLQVLEPGEFIPRHGPIRESDTFIVSEITEDFFDIIKESRVLEMIREDFKTK